MTPLLASLPLSLILKQPNQRAFQSKWLPGGSWLLSLEVVGYGLGLAGHNVCTLLAPVPKPRALAQRHISTVQLRWARGLFSLWPFLLVHSLPHRTSLAAIRFSLERTLVTSYQHQPLATKELLQGWGRDEGNAGQSASN